MTQVTRRTALAGMAAVGLAGVGLAGKAQAADPVRVASKLDAEAGLLGTMILQLLTAAGIPTVNKLRLGNTRITRGALIAGEIDIYPEYTGNGAFFFKVDSDPVWKNAEAGYAKVKALDAAQNIVWLAPAPANNTWGIAVNGDLAKTARLATMADLAAYIGKGGKFKIAGSGEFFESAAALPAFQTAYGFKVAQDQSVVLAGGDTAATERAAAEGTSGVNAAMAYGTDGAIAALGLVVLEDTKSAQMVYAPAPVIRASVLAAYPQIAAILAPAFAALDGNTLRTLNAKISVDGQDAGKVATDWLKGRALLK